LSVIAFKAQQATNILIHSLLGIWSLYERRAWQRWNLEEVERFRLYHQQAQDLIVGRKELEAVREFLQLCPQELATLRSARDQIVAGRIPIFGTTVLFPGLKGLSWNTDWRYGHTWPKQLFLSYDFYEFDKKVPYDVKFPWELSRMNFLLIPSLLAVIEDQEDEGWWASLQAVLEEWRQDNPVARSINWCPMECSMASINLCFVLMLGLQVEKPPLSALQTLLPLCELHGRFIFRTVEYSDIRGNHYAANLTALLLLGILLRPFVAEAGRWVGYVQEHMDEEILTQYSEDGVHFEKTIPYHRLVTQLFLVSLLAREKAGLFVSAEARERIRMACRYVQAYTRPDGLAPLWGDNDDARALWFDTRSLRDHRGLLALGAAYFDDPSLAGNCNAIEVPLLTGKAKAPARSPETECPVSVRHFVQGGMVCARYGRDHFVADVGEVGLRGRGGHGHHDSLSFELSLAGIALIIDPGSYIYTGDPSARNRFRSTAAHNVVRVDGEEMGSFFPRQLWRLGDEATPYQVELEWDKEGFQLAASHDGYLRLADPVKYRRQWQYRPGKGMIVRDRLRCGAAHKVERFFHFAPGLGLSLRGRKLILTSREVSFEATWDEQAQAELASTTVSENYGQEVASAMLILTNQVASDQELFFRIAPVQVDTVPPIGMHSSNDRSPSDRRLLLTEERTAKQSWAKTVGEDLNFYKKQDYI